MRGLPKATQLIWVWLCSYADGYGQCWPSRVRLAKDTGSSTKTVDRHIKQLEKLGWIEKTKRWKDDKQQSNLYQLNLMDRGDKMTPLPTQGGQNVQIGGTKEPHRTKPIELNKEEKDQLRKRREKARQTLVEKGIIKS